MAATFNPSIPNESRVTGLYILISVMTAFLFMTTTARIVTKLACRIRLGYDDYFIILGTALNIAANGCDFKSASEGLGRHAQYLTADQQMQAGKYAQLAVGIATWAIWAVKISICFFLLAIIRGTAHKWFRWAIYALIAITTITSFIGGLLWGLQAKPLPKLWDPSIPGTRSSPQQFVVIVYIIYSFGVVTDILYSMSPIYFLRNSRMNTKKKVTILALIGSGILVTAVAALNIAFAKDFLNETDVTWALVNEFICDITERNVSAIIANLPALWLLMSQIHQKVTTYAATRGQRSQGRSAQNTFADRTTWRRTKATYDNSSITDIMSDSEMKSDYESKEPHALSTDAFDDEIPLRERGSRFETSSAKESGIRVNTEVTIQEENATSPDRPGQAFGWAEPTLEAGGLPGIPGQAH